MTVYATIVGDFERLHLFNFEIGFLKNEAFFKKNRRYGFLAECSTFENAIFPYKTALIKPRMREIQQKVQSRTITKNKFLSLST